MPEARKVPVPDAIKSPKSMEPEPTLPLMVITPDPASRVRLLPEALASTFPVMVMLPAPMVFI